jgi:hypothetical protein
MFSLFLTGGKSPLAGDSALCLCHWTGNEALCLCHWTGNEALCLCHWTGDEALCLCHWTGDEALCLCHWTGDEAPSASLHFMWMVKSANFMLQRYYLRNELGTIKMA